MTTSDTQENQPVDYLEPFETFQAYALRGGMIYRGRIRSKFAEDRARLKDVLGAAPGDHHLEEIDGRLFATLRTYRGRRPPRRLWLHVTLLVLTIITTIAAGAEMTRGQTSGLVLLPYEFGIDAMTDILLGEWGNLVRARLPAFLSEMARGIPYATALLFVLISHEMGHYLAARRHGVNATLPFLLPAPFFFGTFGAIIKMRSPVMHRRALFDVGVAGPLSGLVASLIVCAVGLGLSHQVPMPRATWQGIELGWSPALAIMTRLVMGPVAAGHMVSFHPVAIAGWFGLFVTFLNLMPLGQLDGGHLWYALVGRRQRYVSMVGLGLLAGMGVQFPAWLVLAALALLVFRFRHPPVMDESVRLGRGRVVLGIVVVLVFLLLFVPRPISLVEYRG